MEDILPKLIIIALMILALWLYFKYFKLYKAQTINFIDGSLGTGKTFLTVSLAVRWTKKEQRRWKIKTKVYELLAKTKKQKFVKKYQELKNEKPMLYTNIALDSERIEHVLLTKDLLSRKNYRFTYRSILLIDEFSLVADQMQYKNDEINERLLEFFKLFRHQTRSGRIFINSQTTNDLHYSLKYTMTNYLFISRRIRLPFVSLLKVQEMIYIADKQGNQQVTYMTDGDYTDNLKTMIVLNKYFKYYDTYGYSIFTDGLPVYKLKNDTKKGNLKTKNIVSFKNFKYLYENIEKEKVNNEHK